MWDFFYAIFCFKFSLFQVVTLSEVEARFYWNLEFNNLKFFFSSYFQLSFQSFAPPDSYRDRHKRIFPSMWARTVVFKNIYLDANNFSSSEVNSFKML
jgi:hypothetical protein